jgi:hypothetical protein
MISLICFLGKFTSREQPTVSMSLTISCSYISSDYVDRGRQGIEAVANLPDLVLILLIWVGKAIDLNDRISTRGV